MPKNFQSHKRQKASLANSGYFVPASPTRATDAAAGSLPHHVSQSQPPTPLRSPVRPRGRAQSFHQIPEQLQLGPAPVLAPTTPSNVSRSTSHHSPGDHSLYDPAADPYSQYFHQNASSSASSFSYPMPLVPAPLYQNIDPQYPPHQFPVYSADYVFPKPDRAKHRANLSISSHFNLFNLNELQQPQLPPQVGQQLAAGPFQPPPQPREAGPKNKPLLHELMGSLMKIDSASVNTFLLSLLHRVGHQPPLDDFYNLLYNNRIGLVANTSDKIDKSSALSQDAVYSSLDLYNSILDVFKKPELLEEYVPDVRNKENKLSNINYHELLRTFLAIKILSDMLVQLPKESGIDLQNNNIPRLSLYKTYFIICQQLLLKYPSSDTASNEHHKLILGQSKLGKLIKLVYPDMLIKRLGSRGESKYNYLGVMWNESIVDSEMKSLCDQFELSDLTAYFESPQKMKLDRFMSSKKERSPKKVKQEEESLAMEDPIMPPQYSFVTNDITYPSSFNSIQSNWINSVKFDIVDRLNLPFDLASVIGEVFLQAQDDIVGEFNERLMDPLLSFDLEKIDLRFYAVILLELFPYFILIRDFDKLKVLKGNVLSLLDNSYLITKFPRPSTHAFTVFLLLLKKLANLNDSLLSLIKGNLTSSLGKDIENLSEANLDFFSSNLVQSLISYNFSPQSNTLDLSFVDSETSQLKNFFLNDLCTYLRSLTTSEDASAFTGTDYNNLANLLTVVDSLFDNVYPVQIFVNLFDLTSNDLLKVIFFKDDSNFNSWWVLNAFLQEYVSLVGELVGLHHALS